MFLACQVYPENSIILYKAWLETTIRSYAYLILDVSQDTNDHRRLQTNIFPTVPPPPVIYHAIEDAASEIFLPRSSRTQHGRNETAKSYHFEL